jgi:hypothetical protein
VAIYLLLISSIKGLTIPSMIFTKTAPVILAISEHHNYSKVKEILERYFEIV